MISQISIRNFRSIASADVESNWITTFVGANDAGKSNILRALNLFFNGETNPGEEFVFEKDFNQFAKGRKQKARQVEIKVRFLLPDSYCRDNFPKEVEWKKVWRQEGEMTRLEERCYMGGESFVARSKIPALMDRLRFTYIPAIKDKVFFTDLQGRLYDVLASVAATPLKTSATAFESQIQVQLRELLASIKEVFGAEVSMRMPENLREIFENLEISSEEIPLSRRGDGIKIRHIPMILRFIAEKRDQILNRGGVRYTHIWGFEEPENNVEMAAAFKMAQGLYDLIANNDNFQLFLTTHSPIFYRMSDATAGHDQWVTSHFVQKTGRETQTIAKSPDEVDETMGLMPLVAPFVAEAKKRHDDILRELDVARRVSAQKLPTIFVEGPTDKRVFSKAWKVFSGRSLDAININDGNGAYGGANALTSRSLAWLLEMRHRAVKHHVKAVSVFDSDVSGVAARDELHENMRKLKLGGVPYFHAISYRTPLHLQGLAKRGFNIPVDLEALYPDDIWLLAEKNGWLAEVENKAPLLSPGLVNKLANKEENPFSNLENIDALRLKYRFTDQGKQLAARHVSNLTGKAADHVLASFKPLVEMLVGHLGV